MKQIQLKQVSKCFGNVEVIPPLDLQIEEGEFVVFVGPSGCGKSTLLRLIAGLEDVTTGQVLINGEDATVIPPAKRGLAMVFQSYALSIFNFEVFIHWIILLRATALNRPQHQILLAKPIKQKEF